MNPYSPPAESSVEGTVKRGDRWSFLKRLRLFIGLVTTSLLLTFGFFHAFFLLCLGDPQPFGTDIAHLHMISIVGLGLPIQCILAAIAFNRKWGWAMALCNCVILAAQLYYVFGLIKAVAAGP